jgi:mRNA interferase RelE/StbE
MAYTVRLKPRAQRDLDRLPMDVARRIWRRLLALEDDPRPPGVTKLEASDAYRIRIGGYRIVYLINDLGRFVEVVRVAHRREVYR